MKKKQDQLMLGAGILLFVLLFLFYGPLSQKNVEGLAILKFSFMLGIPILGVGGYNLWNYLFQRREEKTSKEKHKQMF